MSKKNSSNDSAKIKWLPRWLVAQWFLCLSNIFGGSRNLFLMSKINYFKPCDQFKLATKKGSTMNLVSGDRSLGSRNPSLMSKIKLVQTLWQIQNGHQDVHCNCKWLYLYFRGGSTMILVSKDRFLGSENPFLMSKMKFVQTLMINWRWPPRWLPGL